jgi:hypothetical protein
MTYTDTYSSQPQETAPPQGYLVMHGTPIEFRPRSRNQWIAFIAPVLLCGVSWMIGGMYRLNDLGFLILAAACLVFVIGEFIQFPRRFGVGGILLYGGVLVWFCHDYFANWFMQDPAAYATPFSPATVAKASFYYSLFTLCMTIGLRTGGGRWLQRLILSVPEPANENFYFLVMILLAIVGFCPFFIFVSEPFYMALLHGAFSTWTEQVHWTVGRTGNLNYNWGGCVAQIIQVGQVGGIFATLFAIMISTRIWSKVVAWTIWLYWSFFIYNGGRRGELAFMVLPAIAMLFIKYQAKVALTFRGFSLKAYLVCGFFAFLLLVVVQIEGTFRGLGLVNANLSDIDLVQNQGNTMFTEGLVGYQMIPDTHGFFGNRFPGEGLIRPLPEQLYWFLIGPIPRALWTTKPVDPLWEWYNKVVTGDVSGRVGTTIAKGLVGSWYFNYGFWGVIEGGLLVGWLMGLTERCLQNSGGRPMGVLMSMGLAVWLFRLYRDFIFIELYAFIVGAVFLAALVYFLRIFGGAISPVPTGATATSQPALDQSF